MKELIDGFADQLRSALQIGEGIRFTQKSTEIYNVIIVGMGASGIGGDIVKSLYKDKLNVPVEVIKGYTVPNYVNQNTLFIACSYSGNTEETIQCLEAAITKQATTIVITSGGKLAELSEKNGVQTVLIPGGTNCPRASVGYPLVTLLLVLNQVGLISGSYIQQIEEGASLISANKNRILNDAKDIAKLMHQKLPLIYSENILSPISLRFQQQINENSKQLAHVNVFPEMNHNELVGWVNPINLFPQACLIYIKNKSSYEPIEQRMSICKEIFEDKIKDIIEIESKGESLLAQYIYLIHQVDWISFYLAEENNVDPFPVEKINYLKSKLSTGLKRI